MKNEIKYKKWWMFASVHNAKNEILIEGKWFIRMFSNFYMEFI